MLSPNIREADIEEIATRDGVLDLTTEYDHRGRYRLRCYSTGFPNEFRNWVNRGDAELFICSLREKRGQKLIYIDLYIKD